jgi:hypothetical protein
LRHEDFSLDEHLPLQNEYEQFNCIESIYERQTYSHYPRVRQHYLPYYYLCYIPQRYMYYFHIWYPYNFYQNIPYPLSRSDDMKLNKIDNVGGRKGSNIYRFKKAIIFKSDMDIDIDGHPNAYHPDKKLAMVEFNIHGIAKKKSGQICPPVQNPEDPYHGFYPSGTSLYDKDRYNKNPCDPRAYVNTEIYPYFVLAYPKYKSKKWGPVKIGDFGVVINTLNNKFAYAIFADAYPGEHIGEGSMALARELDINPDPNVGGEQTKSIIYIVFPGSGKGQGNIPTLDEILQTADLHFNKWGGLEQVKLIQDQLK